MPYKIIYLIVGFLIICLYAAMGMILHKRKAALGWWCLPVSFLLLCTYGLSMWYVVIPNHGTLFDSLLGDSSAHVAFVNNIIHGNYFGDFYDKIIPANYPPLYFWILGTIGRIFRLDAITLYAAAPLFVLAVLPFLVFAVGKYLGGKWVGFFSCLAMFGIGNAATSYLFAGAREFPYMYWCIAKPYQIVAGILIVPWLVGALRNLETGNRKMRFYLFYGITGGLQILLFYPWFGIGFLVLCLFLIFDFIKMRASRWRKARTVAILFSISMMTSSPFWIPYLWSLFHIGTDQSHAMRYISYTFFDVTKVTIGLGFCGLLFFLGAFGLKWYYRQKKEIAGLALMLMILYGWYFSSFISYPLFHLSFLSSKAYVLIFIVLAFGASFALERLRSQKTIPLLSRPLSLHFIALLLLPSIFQWNPRTDPYLAKARDPIPPGVFEIINHIHITDKKMTVLSTARMGYYLPAVSQFRLYLSPNIHFSHPMAKFTERKESVKRLQALGSEDMKRALSDLGIRLIVFNTDSSGQLFLFVHRSSLPSSLFASDWPYSYEKIVFKREQFESGDFTLIYEDKDVAAIIVQ